MEKHQVLGKLFQVSDRLRMDRANHKRDSQRTATPEEKVKMQLIQGLPNSGKNLLCLLKTAQPSNQRSLAKQMDISAQAVSETVKKLEQAGYITKAEGSQNNETLIALTNQGETVADFLDSRIRSHAEEVLGTLSEEEVAQLYGLLSKMTV